MKGPITICRGPAGMTLIEATIVMAVASGLMVAAVTTLSGAARARQVQSSYGRGMALAQDLLEEILSARYADPTDPTSFGREQGENANNRKKYDDVDDYDGLSSTSPEDKSNSRLPGLSGWSEQVSVVWADPNNPAANSATDQGLKRVTVTVTDPRGRESVLVGLRGRKSIFDTAPAQGGVSIKYVSLNVQVGSNSAAAVSVGTALPNRPAQP
jgi:MSHA pilin protein MshD